jgi:hypothetical protein
MALKFERRTSEWVKSCCTSALGEKTHKRGEWGVCWKGEGEHLAGRKLAKKRIRIKLLAMGADKPIKKEPTTSRKPPYAFVIGVIVLITIVALFKSIDFNATSETPNLSPKEEARLQKRLKEIDDSEQYALVAISDGWYPCNHPGRHTFYLLAGEVWKYGTTTKGKFGRYSVNYLEAMNVSYAIEFMGSISECLKEEQRKLFNYPYLPENLARPVGDRLPRPPYNSKMQ